MPFTRIVSGRSTAVMICVSVLGCSLVGTAQAQDRFGDRRLSDRPAWSVTRSGSLFDNRDRYSGRDFQSGRETWMYDEQGQMIGTEQTEETFGGRSITRRYNGRGGYAGRSVLYGNREQLFDSRGRYSGRSTRSGNTVRYFDEQGRFQGREVRSGSTFRYYDESGRYLGSQR